MHKSNSFYTVLKNHPVTQKFIKTVYETPVEIFIGMAAFGVVGFTYGYHDSKSKETSIPLAFSEIEATSRMYKKQGKPIPVLTHFYSLTNDVVMKVFEAKNLSEQWNSPFRDDNEGFAYELEKKIEPTLRVHATIEEHAKKLPELSKDALVVLKKISESKGDLTALRSELSQTWDASHDDVYRTEYDIETKCDSTGKNCVTTKTPKEVYDHTDHEYDYHPAHGKAAALILENFSIKNPDMTINEDLVLVTSTGADNENAMHHSIKNFKDKYPSAEEYIESANIWAKGSNLSIYLPSIYDNHAHLLKSVEGLNTIKITARDIEYRTYSHSDEGPSEYQETNKILSFTESFDESIHKITDGIEYVGKNAMTLDKAVKEFVDVTLHHKKGDADELNQKIMQIAQTIYKQNFDGGLDIEPFKWGDVFIWTLGGIAVGAAAGALADKGIDKYRQSKKLMM